MSIVFPKKSCLGQIDLISYYNSGSALTVFFKNLTMWKVSRGTSKHDVDSF